MDERWKLRYLDKNRDVSVECNFLSNQEFYLIYMQQHKL